MSMEIKTEYLNPPIPIRSHDWTAHFDGYDGAPDSGHQCTGFGETEEQAVKDLLSCCEPE